MSIGQLPLTLSVPKSSEYPAMQAYECHGIVADTKVERLMCCLIPGLSEVIWCLKPHHSPSTRKSPDQSPGHT